MSMAGRIQFLCQPLDGLRIKRLDGVRGAAPAPVFASGQRAVRLRDAWQQARAASASLALRISGPCADAAVA
jgi:hypothetical protein